LPYAHLGAGLGVFVTVFEIKQDLYKRFLGQNRRENLSVNVWISPLFELKNDFFKLKNDF